MTLEETVELLSEESTFQKLAEYANEERSCCSSDS